MSQNHASCQLDDPEILRDLNNPKSKIRNPKLKWLRQDLNLQLQDSNSCALIPLSYEAVTDLGFVIVEFGLNKSKIRIPQSNWWEREDSNLQPAPSQRAALIPIAPRPHFDLGFGIWDLFQSEFHNHKSQIELAEGTGLEPVCAFCAAVFKTAATPIWLAFRNKNCEESEIKGKKSRFSSTGEINKPERICMRKLQTAF